MARLTIFYHRNCHFYLHTEYDLTWKQTYRLVIFYEVNQFTNIALSFSVQLEYRQNLVLILICSLELMAALTLCDGHISNTQTDTQEEDPYPQRGTNLDSLCGANHC